MNQAILLANRMFGQKIKNQAETTWNDQGLLIQNEKVHIDCEKGAQISFLTKKIAKQWWPNIISKESK